MWHASPRGAIALDTRETRIGGGDQVVSSARIPVNVIALDVLRMDYERNRA